MLRKRDSGVAEAGLAVGSGFVVPGAAARGWGVLAGTAARVARGTTALIAATGWHAALPVGAGLATGSATVQVVGCRTARTAAGGRRGLAGPGRGFATARAFVSGLPSRGGW